MKDMAIVYQGSEVGCDDILRELRGAGLSPVALEDPVSGAIYTPATRRWVKSGFVTVYIAVPRDEKASAEMVLRKYNDGADERINEITRGMWRQLVKTLFWALPAVMIVVLMTGEIGAALPIGLLSWLGVIWVMGKLEAKKQRRIEEGKDWPMR